MNRYGFLTRPLRYVVFPAMLLGFNGVLIALIGRGAPRWQAFGVLLLAIAFMFAAERLIPYVSAWNADHKDTLRDVQHFLVNNLLNHSGVFLLPGLAAFVPFSGVWPVHWPFWVQVVMAVLVLDVGVSAAHHASHKWSALWRFHAVHHSVKRMYGFNGLMKHPVHQMIEGLAGLAPLLLLGVPSGVANAVIFCVAIQLLLQHSNADYRSGPLKYLFANAEVHRFHHRKGGEEGDVNFGLFTTLWDHLAGTFRYEPAAAPVCSDELGIQGEDSYPPAYFAQLLQPFRKQLARRAPEVGYEP